MKNKNPKVDKWFETYDNPLKNLVMLVREIILKVDERIEEDIKWQAPTFMYKGNIASFFPKSKKNVSLMFHKGASIKDLGKLLEGEGDTSRVAIFFDEADLKKKTKALENVIKNWVKMQNGK